MFTLRCARKLLARGLAPSADPPPVADALLGDWYATLIYGRPIHLVLAVSQRTLLPVVLPAREARTLPRRLPAGALEVLQAIGVDPDAARREVDAMAVATIAKTSDRRVIGSLNELVFQLERSLELGRDRDLLGMALWLAKTPMKLLDYESPDVATRALFHAKAILASVSAPT